MMLRSKKTVPSPESEKLLPELREYLNSPTAFVFHETKPSDGIKYSLPMDSGGEHVQFSFMDDRTDPDILNHYHEWERENSVKKSFNSEVIQKMTWKYEKPSEFYHAACIDKRTFHKIKSDYGYKPSRKTALRCCVGLQLSTKEAEDLLKLVGFSLSPSEPFAW